MSNNDKKKMMMIQSEDNEDDGMKEDVRIMKNEDKMKRMMNEDDDAEKKMKKVMKDEDKASHSGKEGDTNGNANEDVMKKVRKMNWLERASMSKQRKKKDEARKKAVSLAREGDKTDMRGGEEGGGGGVSSGILSVERLTSIRLGLLQPDRVGSAEMGLEIDRNEDLTIWRQKGFEQKVRVGTEKDRDF